MPSPIGSDPARITTSVARLVIPVKALPHCLIPRYFFLLLVSADVDSLVLNNLSLAEKVRGTSVGLICISTKDTVLIFNLS